MTGDRQVVHEFYLWQRVYILSAKAEGQPDADINRSRTLIILLGLLTVAAEYGLSKRQRGKAQRRHTPS